MLWLLVLLKCPWINHHLTLFYPYSEIQQSKAELEQAKLKAAELETRLKQLEQGQQQQQGQLAPAN
jgi:hypothetical protein